MTWAASTDSGDDDGSSAAKVEVTGRVAEENGYVKLGAFHTIDIHTRLKVKIEKDEGGWDTVAMTRLNESCTPGRGAEVAAIVCGEGKLCFVRWPFGSFTFMIINRFSYFLSFVRAHDGCTTKTRSSHTS